MTLNDLISSLGSGRAKLGAARKTLERLEKKATPVEAPLPGPIRARQERRAGYESAKQDIGKWMPLVKANREAPTLHFKSDQASVPRSSTTASLAAKHRPETSMEAEVAELLRAAGADTGTAVAEGEEALSLKALTVEEAKQRREKLAKMRALLFYHEVKAKRLKKIKSKEYRRRLKKAAKAKAAAAADAATNEDGVLLLDEDALRKEREQAEFERARERLTLKHKNTSRFVRRALRRGQNAMDEGTREAIAEQLRLGQELRQRVNQLRRKGAGSDDSDTEATDEGSDSSDEEAEDAVGEAKGAGLSSKSRRAALDILEGKGPLEDTASKKGLFALPFMQRAMERRKAAAEEEARNTLAATLEGYAGVHDKNDRNEGVASGSGRLDFQGINGGNAQGGANEDADAVSESDSGSDLDGDLDEDAEARAERLRNVAHVIKGDDSRRGPDDPVFSDGRRLSELRGKGAAESTKLFDVGKGVNDRMPAQQQRSIASEDKRSPNVSIGPMGTSVQVEQGKVDAKQKRNKDALNPLFVVSKSFEGPRAGYVFKKGRKGMGYYWDGDAVGTDNGGSDGKEARAERLRNVAHVIKGDDSRRGPDDPVFSDGRRLSELRGKGAAESTKLFDVGKGVNDRMPAQQQRSIASEDKRSPNVSIGPMGTSVQVEQGKVDAKQKRNKDALNPLFVVSKSFEGPRAGYVFKKGRKGMGYYWDGDAVGTDNGGSDGKTHVESGEPSKITQRGKALIQTKSDIEDDFLAPETKTKVVAAGQLSQEELVRRAFAADDVVAEFAAEKEAEVEGELPSRDIPGELPGWGSWASRQKEPHWVSAARERAEARRRKAAAARKDSGLQGVIISEKWDRRNAKYRTPTVPFPYDSKETYERTMRQPLGRDFNTDAAFRSLTRPAVVKDAGVVIHPIRYSQAMAEHAEHAEKGAKRAPVTVVAGGMGVKSKKRR